MTEQAIPRVGDRVRLIDMPKDPCPLLAGSEGTVSYVNEPVRQIGVKWDSGRSLMLVIGVDTWEILGDVVAVRELTKLAEAHKLGEGDLDDAVHDAASTHASRINNQGVEGQIAFLVENWGVEATRKFIKDER